MGVGSISTGDVADAPVAGERQTYTALYEWDGDGWFVRVVEVDVTARAIDFADVTAATRDAIAMVAGIPVEQCVIRLEPAWLPRSQPA